ncbi:AraC-like DNA-binding protein [Janthinobacterium sp. CG_23.3]|uniref:helix-turn-helix transcriptional regulator n=1 Tax=unclassified Janthinobacterium TaxID=2610881 RepID=UPI00034D068C|nr:helix-turn-helix transcriptional regulator [Janthinobacterium sp. CG3]
MLSYHLLTQALKPVDASPGRLFSYAVMSAVNGFVHHDEYVRRAVDAEQSPPGDRELSEHVKSLLACDVNPLSELIQTSKGADQFATRWNGINRRVSLGVKTMIAAPGIDTKRYAQQGADSQLRQRVMLTFIEHLRKAAGAAARPAGERRLLVIACRIGLEGSSLADVTEALYQAPEADLTECAERLGCSRRTLQRQLHSDGITFGRIKQAVRVCLSADMLRNTHTSLIEVALAAGFYDSAHFSHAMKVASSLSPSDYRSLSAQSEPCPTQILSFNVIK